MKDENTMYHEAHIQIDGHSLTAAQVMALRVAVTNFHMETGDQKTVEEIGPIATAYHARLSEVLQMLIRS